MTAGDARHWRDRMLMLFIAHGWLLLPLNLRNFKSSMYSCSQQLSEAEDGLPRAVLEALRLALGKWTVTFAACSQAVYYKLPAAGTTSSKAAPLPATCAWLFLLGAMRLCWRIFLPPSPYQLWHRSTEHTKPQQKQRQKNNSIKLDKIEVKRPLKTCWHITNLAPALSDQLQDLGLRRGSEAVPQCQLLAETVQQGLAGKLLPIRQQMAGRALPVTLGLDIS